MTNYSIRRANLQDSGSLSNLICELLKLFNAKSGSSFNIDKSRIHNLCKELLPRENFAGFLAIDNITNEPLGMITIAQATAIYNDGDFGVITELYVDGKVRSKGVGKALLESGIEFAKSRNWKKVEVGAPNKTDWPRTTEFYLQNGFIEKGPKLRINIE